MTSFFFYVIHWILVESPIYGSFFNLDWRSVVSINFWSSLLPFNYSVIYTIKFLASLFFLIFIRAGLPRYRYDYLTKLGWSKFLLISTLVLVFNYYVFVLWS